MCILLYTLIYQTKESLRNLSNLLFSRLPLIFLREVNINVRGSLLEIYPYRIKGNLQLLHIVQTLIVTVTFYQFVVLTAFHNLSFVKNEDFIGILDS